MKTLLVGINSKFIHSNLAILSIAKYCNSKNECVDIKEYTINMNIDNIISDIYIQQPDIIGFSCYIWNISYIKIIAKNIRKVMPNVIIVMGGPEVSYNFKEIIEEEDYVNVVISGEGEKEFYNLIVDYKDNKLNNTIRISRKADIMDMNKIPFVYDKCLKEFENKIIYYESSRGCPYRCSYCLSSVEKKLRLLDVERVTNDIRYFLDNKVKQVKFVDRTFNVDRERTKQIWQYMIDNDNGITNFHFEISADLLTQELIDLLKDVRKGYFQFEIGVQSTNEVTCKEINRLNSFDKIRNNVLQIKKYRNIHQHLDLIAGLPYEDYTSFKKSFNDVYILRPEQLQLGFLKVLKGTKIKENEDKYGLKYKFNPPYEILQTSDISYGSIIKLKRIEELLEIYYNSNRFKNSIMFLEKVFKSPFDLYEKMSDFWWHNLYYNINHSEFKLYDILGDFAKSLEDINFELFLEILKHDMYLHQKVKKFPVNFNNELTYSFNNKIKEFYKNRDNIDKYLYQYIDMESKKISKITHIEIYKYNINKYIDENIIEEKRISILYDYINKDNIFNEAKITNIKI